jgi:hypothetical protein
VVTISLAVSDHPAELDLEPVDGGAELLEVDFPIFKILNLVKSQPAKCHYQSVHLFGPNVKQQFTESSPANRPSGPQADSATPFTVVLPRGNDSEAWG